jgi:hypothetical protein
MGRTDKCHDIAVNILRTSNSVAVSLLLGSNSLATQRFLLESRGAAQVAPVLL